MVSIIVTHIVTQVWFILTYLIINAVIIGLFPDPEDEDKTSVMYVAGSGEDIHPASPEAGSWNRSMRLMSNLNRRLYTHGERKYKQYSQQAADMVSLKFGS